MTTSATLEGRLVQLLDLDDNILSLSQYLEVIQKFKIWEYDPIEGSAQLAFSFHWNRFIPERVAIQKNLTNTESLEAFLRSVPDEEIREVYDIFKRQVEEKSKTPDADLYHCFLDAYVKVLRFFDQYTTNVQFIKEFIEPNFENESYISGKDIKWMLERAPDNERKKINLLFFQKLKDDGITKEEITQLTDAIEEKDKKRKDLHNELKEYGKRLGYDDVRIMADIVFNYHNRTNARLTNNAKEIVLNAGVLMTGYLDPDSHETVGEFHFAELKKINPKSYNYASILESKRAAENILRRYLNGEWVSHPEYHTNIGVRVSMESEAEDRKVLQKIKDENLDIPITFGFEVSHCAHGTVVFAYNLKADISGLGENLEPRLAKFLKSIKKNTLDIKY